MKKRTYNILSLLLALSIAVSCLSPAALAAQLEEQNAAEQSVSAEASLEEHTPGAEILEDGRENADAQSDAAPAAENAQSAGDESGEEGALSASAEKGDEQSPSDESTAAEDTPAPEGAAQESEGAESAQSTENPSAGQARAEKSPQEDRSTAEEEALPQEDENAVAEEKFSGEEEPAQREVVRSAEQVSQFLAENWSEDYFQEAVVDTKKNRVTVDGQPSSVEEVFGEEAEEAELFDSAASAQEYLEDTPFEVQGAKGGKVTVTSPFQTCRIVVTASSLKEDWGAKTILEWPQYHQFVLQFEDEAATQAAYEGLSQRYECYVDQVFTMEDSLLEAENWGAEYMGMSDIRSQGTFSSAETIQVAVIDTGCDKTNQFFSGRKFSDLSRNITAGNDDYSDKNSHGTHVAGIIHTCTPSNVELMILRVYDDAGRASVSSLDIALKYALENGAEVVNISLGKESSASVSHSLDAALSLAKRKNVSVVCSAGNNSQDMSKNFPACLEDTIAVSAINRSGQFAATFSENPDNSVIGTGAVGSSYGDGIDFCAPGVNVVSAVPGGTASKSGTSMAAPHIAAAFAWLRLEDPSASSEQLYERMKELCVDLGETGKDKYYGWGCPKLSGLGTQGEGHQHQWEKTVVQPTCTTEGYTRYYCSECGEERIRDVVGPDHDFDGNGVCTVCKEQKITSFGNGFTWKYNNKTETLTVTGSGNNDTLSSAPWEKLYPENTIRWVALKNVEALDSGLFEGYSVLEGVDADEQLSQLGQGALCACPVLKYINCDSDAFTLQDGVVYDKNLTTLYCSAPAAVSGTLTIPNTVKTINPRALEGCTEIEKLILPTSLTDLGKESLKGCTGLTEIYARSDVTSLGKDACAGVTATVFVSQGCTGWEESKRGVLGGNLTWDSYVGDLGQWEMSLNSENWSYTGETRRPGIILKCGGKALHNVSYIEDNVKYSANYSGCFTASYTNNVNLAKNDHPTAPPTATAKGTGIYYGSQSKTFTIYLKTPVVEQPENTASGVLVKWSAVTGADWYQLMRKVGDGDWENVSGGATSATSCTDKNVVSGETYTYKVSSFTNEYDPVTDDPTYRNKYISNQPSICYFAAPELKQAQLVDETVRIDWGSVEGASSYQVLRKDAQGEWQTLAETEALTYTDTQPVAGGANCYSVRAVGSEGKLSAYHSGISVEYVAKPAVSALSCQTGGVYVQWQEVTGAKKYRVFCKSGSGEWKSVGDTTTLSMLAATSDGETALRSGTTYAFTVRCVSADGSTYTSAWDTAGKTVVYLSAPELKCVELADASLCLSWEAVEGAQSYEVLRKDAQGQWQSLAETKALTYTDSAPISGITNCYSVRALDGKGGMSAYHAGITADYVSKPVVSALECEGSGVRVKWGAVTGAKRYRVFCKTGSGGWKAVGDTTSTTMLVKTSDGKTALRSGTTYAFTVRCVSADGSTYTSGYDAVGKSLLYLSVPKIGSAVCEGSGVRVKWGKVTGAKKYRVFCKTGSGGWKKVGDTTSTSVLVKTSNGKTALRTGTSYAFTVRCISADGKSYTSGYNSTGKAVVFVAAPNLSKLTNAKKQTLTVQWKRLSGAGGYQVQLALNRGFTSSKKTLKVSGGGKVKATAGKLKKKKRYYVRVRAWRKSGSRTYYSGWSSVKTITVKK